MNDRTCTVTTTRSGNGTRWVTLAFALTALLGVGADRLAAQDAAGSDAPPTFQRILDQDPEADNLSTPAGYETGPVGELGRLDVHGTGPGHMVLIPGLGFGGEVFESLVAQLEADYTMHVATLPGFGGTAALPTPDAGTSFGEQTWTNSSVDALGRMIEAQNLTDIVLVGHWMGGTQVAARLAERYPERVKGLVFLAGTARFEFPATQGDPDDLERRIQGIDQFMAPRWFKTVTRETWDDNNFIPSDYAEHPVLGLRYWRQAATPSLHVWVRYLCEFYAQDTRVLMRGLDVPTLLVRPDFDGAWTPPGNDYLNSYANLSWGELTNELDHLSERVVEGARIVVWGEREQEVASAMTTFIHGLR